MSELANVKPRWLVFLAIPTVAASIAVGSMVTLPATPTAIQTTNPLYSVDKEELVWDIRDKADSVLIPDRYKVAIAASILPSYEQHIELAKGVVYHLEIEAVLGVDLNAIENNSIVINRKGEAEVRLPAAQVMFFKVISMTITRNGQPTDLASHPALEQELQDVLTRYITKHACERETLNKANDLALEKLVEVFAANKVEATFNGSGGCY